MKSAFKLIGIKVIRNKFNAEGLNMNTTEMINWGDVIYTFLFFVALILLIRYVVTLAKRRKTK